MFSDTLAQQHLIGYSLMEADPLKHKVSVDVLCTSMHLHTITHTYRNTQGLFLFFLMEAGP